MGMTNSANFPVLNAAQSTYGGGGCTQPGQSYPCFDVFITKLNRTGSALVYSTYLGGNSDEAFFFHQTGDIAVDPSGYAYVTGYTESLNFPTVNAIQTVRKGGVDAYVTKLSPDGSQFIYSTYLGGFPGEIGFGIAADAEGHAYVAGLTYSSDFPTTPGSFQPNLAGDGDGFISKLQPDGSGFVYSSFLGGSDHDGAGKIAVDTVGNAYVTGSTWSTNFPTRHAFQSAFAGYADAFITKFNVAGSALLYSSYLGGAGQYGQDGGTGISVDSFGNAYVAGNTRSATFPTFRAFQGANAGYVDAFVTKVTLFGRGQARSHPL
jgi:hypothetical protein